MKPEEINIKNLIAFGESEITLHDNFIWVKAGKGSGICTKSFQSREETVLLQLCGRAESGTAMKYLLYAYDAQKTEHVVYSENIQIAGDNGFEVTYRFDPISLAVYQNAESFRVALCANTENAEFSVRSISLTEERAAARESGIVQEQTNHIVTLENGEKGVPVLRRNGERIVVPVVPKKVLFVGNSLLLGMFNLYGMCSSSSKNDYAYYVQQEILKYNRDCVFAKLHGSGFEHAESMEDFEDWFFREPNSYTQKPAVESFTKDLDLIFIQLTDNVNTDKKISNFANAADRLMEYIKDLAPNARIIWIHGWYNRDNTYDELVALCRRWELERIDISDLHTRENEAFLGQLCENAAGERVPVKDIWVTHPGDKGMKEIARRMIKVLGIRE